MKNLSIVLNIILLAAVVYLYYLHFSSGTPAVSDEMDASPVVQSAPAATLPAGSIVYVNSDSLLDAYDFYKSKKSAFESSQKKMQTELKSASDKLQQDVMDYQQQAGAMTENQRIEKEEQFAKRQQQLMQRKDELLDKLDEEQSKGSEELYDRLNAFLKKYNRDKNYMYVLGYQKGGGILMANDSLNITADVIKGLNEEYAKEKSAK